MLNTSDLISYWVNSSDNDFQGMLHLYEKGHYTWSLFIGHLVIEKLLKAVFTKKFEEHPPFIHDLYRLAEKSKIEFNEKQKDQLDSISTFNIKARYDDYKWSSTINAPGILHRNGLISSGS